MKFSETFRNDVNMDFANTKHGGFLIQAQKNFEPKIQNKSDFFWIFGSKLFTDFLVLLIIKIGRSRNATFTRRTPRTMSAHMPNFSALFPAGPTEIQNPGCELYVTPAG